jgi:SAM-dependent methyltransferase
MLTSDNSSQIADWDGATGQRWAELWRETDRLTRPFGEEALRTAAPRSGEHALDIGCGCGETTLRLAELVSPGGTATGVDVSTQMLEVARLRAGESGHSATTFIRADASAAPLGGPYDLMYSRFGVMFFSEPGAAFRHIRQFLNPRGRLVMACWREPAANPWASVPVAVTRSALGLETPQADPASPGPFAFADSRRVESLLSAAGFSSITTRSFDADILLGDTPAAAAAASARIGPLARMMRDLTDEQKEVAAARLAAAFAESSGPGEVRLSGSIWIFSASA